VAFYLLLIIPHLLALGGLFAFAAMVKPGRGDEAGADGSDGGGGGGLEPPLGPAPVRPSGGLPLEQTELPARRLRVGENLADLHPARPRRDHEPEPARRPVRS
jgi:hypothetical protein